MTEINQYKITCPKCSSFLLGKVFTSLSDSTCPTCGLVMTVKIFPRVFKPNNDTPNINKIITDKESSCYYHVDKVAVSHCLECGRFLCSLCKIEIEGRTVCPLCLELLDSKKEIKSFTTKVTNWDSITLSTSILPLLVWPLTMITAPITLIFICKHFNCVHEYVIPRRRWRFYLAGLFAILQVGGWIAIIARLIL
ncbi:MAG: hypothetical protein V1872_06650 [bacterium]